MGGNSSVPSKDDFLRENPFEKYRDDLEQDRLNNRFLGHTMFWRNSDQLPTKYIYHTANIEYRSMKMMCLECFFYMIYIISLTMFVTMFGSSVDYETREQQLAFWKLCEKPEQGRLPVCGLSENTRDGFWKYMKEDFAPLIFSDKDFYPSMFDPDFLYDLDETSGEWSPRYLGDTKATVVLGAIRMRQLRVLPNQGCTIFPANLSEVHPLCYGRFTEERQWKHYYAKRRIPAYIKDSFYWQPRNETEMQPVTSTYGTYPGDGFVRDMPLNYTLAQEMLRDLDEWDWIDIKTRAIIVEVNTFNPNVNVIAVNQMIFEFGPSGSIKTTHQVFILPTAYLSLSAQGSTSLFAVQVGMMICNSLFFLYHLYLLKQDFGSYMTYTWNIVDLVNLALFISYVYYRAEILSLYNQDNSLQPELAGMPDVYMPYVELRDSFLRAQSVLAWLCLFVWVRAFKYLSLSKTFRVLIRTLERCMYELALFSLLYISVTIGFTISFVVGFGGPDTTEELYASFEGCFFTLFFMLVGGVNLEPILGKKNWLSYLLFIAYMFLIVLLLFNFFMAIVIDTYTRVSIQLADFSPEASKKKNPCMVFLYTYWHKLKGQALVKEDEENIGHPDEQYIETELLPGFLRDMWVQKQHELIRMVSENEDQIAGNRKNGGFMGSKSMPFSMGSKQGPGAKGSKLPPALNDRIISRLQLQRLLDDDKLHGDDKLAGLLGSNRAIDIIRRFRAERGPDPMQEINRLQENVIIKLDGLEKLGMQLDFQEVETLKMVSQGLNDALTDVQHQWRVELTTLLEVASTVSSGLIGLTEELKMVVDKHNEIVRDIDPAGM